MIFRDNFVVAFGFVTPASLVVDVYVNEWGLGRFERVVGNLIVPAAFAMRVYSFYRDVMISAVARFCAFYGLFSYLVEVSGFIMTLASVVRGREDYPVLLLGLVMFYCYTYGVVTPLVSVCLRRLPSRSLAILVARHACLYGNVARVFFRSIFGV